MDVQIKRIDTTIPLPEYKTKGAVAVDLAVRTDALVAPGAVAVLPLNVVIKPPPGHFVLMAARRSLWKRGLQLVNGVGIFDEDYAGDGDEYHAIVRNFTDAPVTVNRGDRLTQILVLPYQKVSWTEVQTHGDTTRGGIGSTGI